MHFERKKNQVLKRSQTQRIELSKSMEDSIIARQRIVTFNVGKNATCHTLEGSSSASSSSGGCNNNLGRQQNFENHHNHDNRKRRLIIKHLVVGCATGEGGCDSIIANEASTEQRLQIVGQQLMDLVRDPSEPNQNKKIIKNGLLIEQTANQSTRDCERIATIIRIYLKLIDLNPIELHMRPKAHSSYQVQVNREDILHSRQQVLNYIEKLDGYCDSINSLRLILKSTTMISVMTAYTKIIAAIEQHQKRMRIATNLSDSRITKTILPRVNTEVLEWSI